MIFFGGANSARLVALDRSQAIIEFKIDGTIVDANENFLATVGYSLSEIKGRHHSLFVDTAERDSLDYRDFWAALAKGEFQRAEYKRIGKGGREIWLQATYNPILGRNGRTIGVVKFATDITAEKRRNADNMSQIEAIGRSQGVIEFALDGTILTANANFLTLVGHTRAEVVGQQHRMFVTAEERDGAPYRAFWEALARGTFQAGEFRRAGRDGREIWLQASYNPVFDHTGKVVKIVKFASDITAEKRRNAEMQGQVDAISRSQGVIHFDLDGHVLDANANFLGVLGYGLEQIRGQHHRMLVDQAYAASADYQAFWSALRRGEYQAGVFQRVGAGGRDIWIQASYNPIFDVSGKPFKIVKYATDVSGRMRSQIEVGRTSTTMLTNVQTVASAAEELNASISEIAGSLARSRQEVDEMDSRAQRVDRSTMDLANAANSMNGIVQLIQGVGGQINLLALNATIEAARAGEAGRGFAVVAGEVKNLSNQVTSATARIAEDIKAMQSISVDVVGSLSAIGQSIVAVREIVTGVAAAIEEQSAVTGEISLSMQIAASGVAEIDRNIQALAS
ncbi:PAS domain S-box protein [Methylobacterium sp. J-068]|uniref:methyl-accepting chemotaxis protein n=1 Tax=Methylobacterium sp. J-068 TaxID=2836649 RepID=UPI001FB92AB5|nr:PAS domain-containing methyl-accepting chemotaxis protein [Methylobacterium sp. J-068]MCJ2033590.1 PAS domain S-box protein [Methylobacterium sp. J-068]